MEMELVSSLHMKGGNGESSYAENSVIQRKLIKMTKAAKEAAVLNLYRSGVFPVVIADLGCSTGPNALLVAYEVVEAVDRILLRTHLSRQLSAFRSFFLFPSLALQVIALKSRVCRGRKREREMRLTLLLLAVTLSHSAAHYNPPPPSSSSSISDWQPARATYYASIDPRDTVGGACGYGDLEKAGYGKATVGLSTSIFERGQICGACFEIRCVQDLRNCIPGTSLTLTATNFCAPNFGFAPDAGGKCNPPNKHFVLPIEAFEKIALWKAGNMPIQYRRVKCRREGGIRYAIDGSEFFLSVLISNVAGVGDIVDVKIKGSQTGWLQMGRNWGQSWIISADLKNQPLSFEVTTSDEKSVISYNVAPKTWDFGQTFEGKQFE